MDQSEAILSCRCLNILFTEDLWLSDHILQVHLGVPVVTGLWLTDVAMPRGRQVTVSIAMWDVRKTCPPSRRPPRRRRGGGWRPPVGLSRSVPPAPIAPPGTRAGSRCSFLTTICLQASLDHKHTRGQHLQRSYKKTQEGPVWVTYHSLTISLFVRCTSAVENILWRPLLFRLGVTAKVLLAFLQKWGRPDDSSRPGGGLEWWADEESGLCLCLVLIPQPGCCRRIRSQKAAGDCYSAHRETHSTRSKKRVILIQENLVW